MRAWPFIAIVLLFSFGVAVQQANSANANLIGHCGDYAAKHYLSISAIRAANSRLAQKDSNMARTSWVITEGIVTLDKSKDYGGFWIQQAEKAQPKNQLANTSTGIFVYHNQSTIKRGQRIRLLAQVANYHELIELKKVKALKICTSPTDVRERYDIPKPQVLALPVNSFAELDALVGMRIRIPQTLVVSDLFGAGYGLKNYGQFAVSSHLHMQPTERSRIKNERIDKALDYLLVDDGSSERSPKYIPFPNLQGFSAHNPLRIGDHIEPLTAVLHRYDEFYILVPESLAELSIKTQARPKKAIVSKAANLVVASMNVGNYFNGHPRTFNKRDVGFPTARGAKTYQQFVLQTQKLVAALSAMDADVIALMELENDGYGKHSAIADLTRALNKQFKLEKQYRYIKPKHNRKLGRGGISVGLLYRYHVVMPAGDVSILDSKTSVKTGKKNNSARVDALFNDGYHRPSLLQKLQLKKTSRPQEFYLAVNHFKSKGRPCKEKKDDRQGHCYIERKNAALALVKFIEEKLSDKTTVVKPPVLIVGDLNSYSQEEPLQVLKASGYYNLNEHWSAKSLFFSYSFQGYLGNLDHALANHEMLTFIRSIDSWHINSVEDTLLKYDSDYAVPDAYRSSDHDPLVIGIEF